MYDQENALQQASFGPGFQTVSIVYSGAQMTKAELLAYLYEITRCKKEFEDFSHRSEERKKQINALEVQTRRRTFPMEYREPPRGFAALSRRKKQNYQTWLNAAPSRETEHKRREAEEDARIAALHKQIAQLQDEELRDTGRTLALSNKYKDHMMRQVLAPDYRQGDIPQLLLTYLFNGRAQTLTEAINLYHEEKYRLDMRNLAEQQRREMLANQQRQLNMAWQQMEMQRQQVELQQKTLETAKEARTAAKNAEFLSWLNLLSDLN